MTGPECSFNLLTSLMSVLEVDLEALSAGELETGTERRNEDSISLQPGTSQERQTSNNGVPVGSMGLPPQHTAELPELE